MGRKNEHPGLRAIGLGIVFPQKKDQVLQNLFRNLDIGGNEENRAVEVLKQPGQDISPGPGSEALDVRLAGFPGEGCGQMLRSGAGGGFDCHY